ncbi:MAG: PTS sugar transporter subunit IIA [Desulfamplus sp.]|nr:PTS sugar transporter subunit IIA [Desulfamplus sp.]
MKQSLNDIAERLGLNPDTLERWIRQGKIPVTKKGDMAIYNVAELNRWAEKQRRTGPHPQDDHHSDMERIDGGSSNIVEPSGLILMPALKRGGVFHGIQGIDKNDLLARAVELVPKYPGKDSGLLLAQLIERENLTSTGIGKGVAIPHPRNPVGAGLCEPIVVTCFLEREVPFNSIDDKPVFVLFLLLSPTIEVHLNLLSRLSYCLRSSSFMGFIKERPDAEKFLTMAAGMEMELERPGS